MRDLIDYACRPVAQSDHSEFHIELPAGRCRSACQSARARTGACGFVFGAWYATRYSTETPDDGRSRGALPAVQAGGGKRPGQLAGLARGEPVRKRGSR